MIEWDTGEITDEPLSLIAADDPVTCAEYAKKHDLLHLDGWKRLKHIAKNQKQLTKCPNGYQKRRVHLIFAVKHDGRHKARLVAGGHLTPDPIGSIYSGVVSIRSLRLVIFLAKLNNLEVWGADIGNAYLEAKTKEKGPELRNLRDIYWLYTKHYMD